jgi:uncharacterized CHY-type Zn-finger protein
MWSVLPFLGPVLNVPSSPSSARQPLTHFSHSKHVLNAQVAIRSPCCKKWFDCADCHRETENHTLTQSFDMTFACKKCKKCFRKDAREFEDAYVNFFPPFWFGFGVEGAAWAMGIGDSQRAEK